MSYPDPEPRITWDRPGLFQGVTIEREIHGTVYAERVPHNGLVSQALAAQLLGVSLMSVCLFPLLKSKAKSDRGLETRLRH